MKTKLKHYKGMLGYEAMYNSKTGYFVDVYGKKGYDKFFKGL